MVISIYPEQHRHTLIFINCVSNFSLLVHILHQQFNFEAYQNTSHLVCIFCVSKCLHFSSSNLMGCSWNISSCSWNSAAVFDAWVRESLISDARISVVQTTTNVCFLIGSLHLWSFIPAFCCVYNKPNLITMLFIPEPCQTGVKWKLCKVLGGFKFRAHVKYSHVYHQCHSEMRE